MSYELLEKEFTFPFQLHDYQIESVDEAVEHDCVLLRHTVGYGKTVISTATALLHSIEDDVERILVLAPPILMDQWAEWLGSIKGIDSVLVYRGTPEQRKKMVLDDPVIIMSYNIFRGKKDWPRIKKLAKGCTLAIIADELSCKSLKSQTYRKIKQIVYRKLRVKLGDQTYHKLIALNATPISKPEHVYNWLACFRPGVYFSKKQFEALHVLKTDVFGEPEEWGNEELLRDNMALISVDSDKDLIKLPPILYDVVPYSLDKKHLDLYKKIANAELEQLPPDKLELALNSMFSTLQKLVLNPAEFGLDVRPAFLDFLDQYLDQIGNEQVIIFTRHVAVTELIRDYVQGAVAIYGRQTKLAKERAFAELKGGEAGIAVINMDSGSHGLNLQFCNRQLLAELPFRGDKFEQMTGRIHRQGQTKTCFISIPLAKSTLQRSIYNNLLKNDDQICKILRDRKSIREFILDQDR